MAIEELELGDRVLTTDASAEQQSTTTVDPGKWRQIILCMSDGREEIQVEVLRPQTWIAQTGARTGASIPFEIEEIGVAGIAEVIEIKQCPPIETGDGRVVSLNDPKSE